MAVYIKFDSAGTPELPECILSKQSGEYIGPLNTISQVHFSDNMNSVNEFSFLVYKTLNGKMCNFWNDIRDFRLIHIPAWDTWFKLRVEINEDDDSVKSVTANSMCEEELSNIKLFYIEINTTQDIERDDYVSTVLYNEDKPKGSLLNRLLNDKVPHYRIVHVDDSIKNLQRTFSFNNTSIYDAFQEIAEEIHCLFIFRVYKENNILIRTISVYDLESKCTECGYRGEFVDRCPKCNSDIINEGYGKDTTIFVSKENLSENISYSTDVDSVKNCFKLESGDADMDAAIINCNPSGSDYLQYITDAEKEDMSEELVNKLNSYDVKNHYYTNEYQFHLNTNIINSYNQLVKKYKSYNDTLEEIKNPLTGYRSLMKVYYDTIDFSGYLQNSLMPSVTISETSAEKQIALLTPSNLSPVSLENINYISLATANSVILSYAKVYIDTSKYRIKVNSSVLNGVTWTGSFVVTSYSDEEDTATSSSVSITFNNNYENFIKQKIEKILAKEKVEDISIVGLFEKNNSNFKNELKKYSLTYLQSFHNACQSCMDILIEQGISENKSQKDLYNSLYKPYFNKLNYISSEIKLRENEINIINGTYDLDGTVINDGVYSIIEKERNNILKQLDFKKYLGIYWPEFCSFRKEDLWRNDNYISDGLSNLELFKRAEEFLEAARKDLIKSATLQHVISSTLKNLLVIDEFKPILNYFSVGNWIRLMVDGRVYKLRLIGYEIDFDNLDTLSVTFSDVVEQLGSISDIQSILKQSQSISTSYSSVKHQAEKFEENSKLISGWTKKGLDATVTKIVNNAENQTVTYDEHGLLFREFDSVTNTYSLTQAKIINSTMAFTTDDWETSKTAIGKFLYFDPVEKKYKTGYGVIAETIVGNVILGESVGIYNESGGLSFTNNGLDITNGVNSFKVNPNSQKLLSISNASGDVFYVDKNGGLHIKGDGAGLDISANSTTTAINLEVSKKVGNNEVISKINQSAEKITIKANKISLEGLVTVNNNFKVLSDGSIEAKNAKFSGNITGSTITGSSLTLKYDNGNNKFIVNSNGINFYCPEGNIGGGNINFYSDGKIIVSLYDDGLSIIGDNFPPGIMGGIGQSNVEISSRSLSSYSSPISVRRNGENFYWYGTFSQDCNMFRFVHNSDDDSYLEIQTPYEAFGLTAWHSDKRLKENINKSEINGIDEILKIQHFEYDWISKNNHVKCGYIAQDMLEANPKYVLAISQENGDVVYQINEHTIIPVITKALQELIVKVQAIEKIIEKKEG